MRRQFALLLVCLAIPLAALGDTAGDESAERVIILGIDGMDPVLLQSFMDQGLAPNLRELAETGGFMPLGTSVPPQSPVAWSNFITGMDSGAHGIFDFLHLDRDTLTPYLSTARVAAAKREPLAIGRWRIPLSAGETLQLRDGTAFWELLEAQGIATRLFRIPANYPPIETGGYALSGMGTPDLQGTSGTFSYFTDDPAFKHGPVSGGMIRRVRIRDGVLAAQLEGPPNAFLDGAPRAYADFTVHVDAENPVALISVGEERALLNSGEWSDWIRVEFELVPQLVRVPGMVRFFLRDLEPHFALYASPINIDPRDAAQRIATPAKYAAELAEAAGPFYTQEMPEDTKALAAHVLTPREFLAQSGLVLDERRRLLAHELEQFKRQPGGLLFFYFSSLDQRHHMLARQMDSEHPFHDEDTPPDLEKAVQTTYSEMDAIVGFVMDEMQPGTRLIVMSDHGFAPFRRQANLNSWLEQHGYLRLKDPGQREQYEWLQGIDWARTRAFAIGLNSLYLNVHGREKFGIVDPAERARLAAEIAQKLGTWRDESTGEMVVTEALVRERVYNGPHVGEAPDILVGYARGYRASWATTSGKIPAGLIEDNDDEWSGDHCMDSREVPGVLLANRPLRRRDADLRDLTATILTQFGIEVPDNLQGQSVF